MPPNRYGVHVQYCAYIIANNAHVIAYTVAFFTPYMLFSHVTHPDEASVGQGIGAVANSEK